MRVKVIKAFIGRKNERVNPDNSVIPVGTNLEVDADRKAYLEEAGYIDTPANKAKKFRGTK